MHYKVEDILQYFNLKYKLV